MIRDRLGEVIQTGAFLLRPGTGELFVVTEIDPYRDTDRVCLTGIIVASNLSPELTGLRVSISGILEWNMGAFEIIGYRIGYGFTRWR